MHRGAVGAHTSAVALPQSLAVLQSHEPISLHRVLNGRAVVKAPFAAPRCVKSRRSGRKHGVYSITRNVRSQYSLGRCVAKQWCVHRWFSSEGMIMYPIAKVLCPLLYPRGITPNQITLFNVLVSLANAWTICKCLLQIKIAQATLSCATSPQTHSVPAHIFCPGSQTRCLRLVGSL